MAKKFCRRTISLVTILLLTSWLMAYAADMMPERSAVGYVAASPHVGEGTSVSSSPERWDLARIMAPRAWQITSGRPDIVVAVLDTGIAQTQQDLAGKVVASINLTQSPTANDISGHGTHIAGIIAASANTFGTTGVAYNTTLMNVKVATDDGFCNAETVAKGIIWAVDNGAKVVNVSLAINKSTAALEKAVAYAWEKGAIVIAAAGNNYDTTPVYPAAYPNVISVAATDKNDNLPNWSNRGNWVTVAAPGVDIYSTLPGDKYSKRNGTSQAAALVSGEAALLFTIATDTNGNGRINDEVRNIITGTVDQVTAAGIGQGRVNVLKAAEAVGAAQ